MVKSVSVVLGYLFAIATTYYLIFWGNLGIDIFQYISVGDIIKGIAYPMRTAGGYYVVFIVVVVTALAIELLRNRGGNESIRVRLRRQELEIRNLYKIMLALGLLALLIGGLHYNLIYSGTLEDAIFTAIPAIVFVSLFFTSIYVVADYYFDIEKLRKMTSSDKVEIKNKLLVCLDYFTIATASYFFVSALSFGSINARRIIEHKEYNYIVPNKLIRESLSCDSSRLIYLGTISDKCILSDSLIKKYFVVSKEKLPVLPIYRYYSKNVHSQELNAFDVIQRYRVTRFFFENSYVISFFITNLMLLMAIVYHSRKTAM